MNYDRSLNSLWKRIIELFHNDQDTPSKFKRQLTDPELMSSILNSTHDGISVHDKEFNIVLANATMEKLFPNMLPLEGKKCYNAFFGLNEPCSDCQCKKALQTGEGQAVRAMITTPSIGPVWLETHAYPTFDRANNVTGVIIYHHNATEYKRLESSRDRTELYMDLMSHDIKNMTQIALGNLEIIQGEPQAPDVKRMLSASIDVLNDISNLVHTVSTLKAVESEKLMLEPTDISRTIAHAVGRYTNVPGKSVLIDYKPVASSMTMADSLITDAFTNLIDNSIRHTPGDQVRITIAQSTVKLEGKSYHRITIEDNGPGIPDEYKRRIFERSITIDSKERGKGLGLYLVKTLIDRYDGRVWAEDRVPGDPDKGSRFVVLLPKVERV